MRTPLGKFAGTFVWTALALAAFGASCSRTEAGRPNIILISVDTLNRSGLRAFEPTAPALSTLDAFASQALVFDRAYSTSSWTLPAHASLLTGLYPDRHGATHSGLRIQSQAETLATALDHVGYTTLAFTGGGFVDGSMGFLTGFHRFNEVARTPETAELDLPRDGRFDTVAGRSLFDRAITFLGERSPAKPFFLFLQTYSVHDYYQVHPWAAADYPGREFHDEGYYGACLDGSRNGTEQDWRDLRDLYQAELRHLDGGLARLLDELDRHDLRRNTIVALVSDHGEGFDPHNRRIHHGGRLNADLIRVPVLFRGPGIEPGHAQDAISLVDLFPTLVELVGAAVPTGLDGVSFASVLRGTGHAEDRPLYAQEYMYFWANGRRGESKQFKTAPFSIAVIDDDHWYIRGPKRSEEFYDPHADPEQLHNLAGSSDEIEPYRELVDQRERYTPPVEHAEADDAVLERLKQLGYIDR